MSWSAAEILRIGQLLLKKKEQLPYGQWEDWLETGCLHLGFSDATARRFMNVARKFTGDADLIGKLSAQALYRLASKRTSRRVAGIVLRRLEKGQKVTLADIEALALAEADLKREMPLFIYDDNTLTDKSQEYLSESLGHEHRSGGFVYILRGRNGIFRIGQTGDLTERLSVHRRNKPISPVCYVIMVDDPEREEARLHSLFRGKRLMDDWFSLSDDDISQILAMYE